MSCIETFFSIIASLTCKSQDRHELRLAIHFIISYQSSLAAIMQPVSYEEGVGSRGKTERIAMLLRGVAPNFCIHIFCTQHAALVIILNGAASVQFSSAEMC